MTQFNINFLIVLNLLLILISCNKKEFTNEKEFTNPNGYVEYLKTIKEHPDGNNYYPGYKQVELKRMLERKNNLIANNSDEDNNFLFGASAAAVSTFTERGPNNASGRTRAIIADAADPSGNSYYAASIGGGIWKGIYNVNNLTMSWSNLSPQIENLDFVSLAQSKSNPSVIYAGTGEKSLSGHDNGSGIFKSSDAGLTWVNIAPLDSEGRINPRFSNVYRIIVDPNNSDVVIIATEKTYYCDSYIYKSTDGGNLWNEVYSSSECYIITQVIAAPSNFNIQYAAIKGGDVLKSSDAGNTWTRTSHFAGKISYKRNEIVVSHSNPEIVYAGIKTYEDFPFALNVTYDGGNTWHHVKENESIGNPDYNLDNWLGQQGNYNNFIAINPYADSVVYVGDINIHKFTILDDTSKISLHITDVYNDIDSDEVLKKNGYVHPDQHTMTTFSDGNGKYRLIVGNDGGPAISNLSSDPGVNDNDWQATQFMWAWDPKRDDKPQIDIGYRSTQFYSATKVKGKNQYLGGTQDNGSYLTGDPNSLGLQFARRVNSGDGFEVITHWDNPNQMMVVCQYNGCARISYDGGINGPSSFQGTDGFYQDDRDPFYSKLATSKQDPDMIYGITKNGVIRSENFGDDWEYIVIEDNDRLSTKFRGNDVEVSQANPRFVWAGGQVSEDNGYNLYLSKDWGKTYSPVPRPEGKHHAWTSGIYSHPNEDSTVYLLFSYFNRSKIYESRDLGNTWKDLTGFPSNFESGTSLNDFPDVGVNSFAIMPFDSDVMWAGTEIGIMETTDRGETWNIVSSNLPYVNIQDMNVMDQGQIVIATYGRGIWTAEIPDLLNWEPKEALVTLSIDGNQTASLDENLGSAIITATLSREVSPSNPAHIVLSTAGTASSSDYSFNNTIIISSGNTGTTTINVIQDSDDESDETVIIGISSLTNAKELDTQELTVTIVDDDDVDAPPFVSIGVDKSNISENNEVSTITATLDKAPNSGDVVVSLSTTGTASSSDYTLSSNTITISSGTTGTSTITSVQDSEDESDEVVVVEILSVTNGNELGIQQVTITINDDDEPILGFENGNLEKSVNIFPNPTSGIINVRFDETWYGEVDIKLIDIFGRVQYINRINNSNSILEHQINILNKNDGIFLLELLQNDKKVVRKIVKK